MTDRAAPPGPGTADVTAAKVELRRAMLARRSEMPEEMRILASRTLTFEGVRGAIPHRFGITSGYIAIRGEIDPALLLESLHKRDVPLALPRLTGRDLVFHAWAPGDPLVPGRFGIPEPLPDTPVVQPAVIDRKSVV